jgi:hypothetical protein
MIEVPAAALSLPMFIRKLDFLSIGTNDLIQYTLAIDRTDDAVAHLYDPLHPAVLHLISHTIQTANRGGVPIAVCGEMAGDTKLTRLLLGFGLRNFSMHAQQLLAWAARRRWESHCRLSRCTWCFRSRRKYSHFAELRLNHGRRFWCARTVIGCWRTPWAGYHRRRHVPFGRGLQLLWPVEGGQGLHDLHRNKLRHRGHAVRRPRVDHPSVRRRSNRT